MRILYTPFILLFLLLTLNACKTTFTEAKDKPTDTTTVKNDTLARTLDSLKNGLLAYYPFNGSPTDSSGQLRDAVPHDITFVADKNGKAASAVQFNGKSSYLIVDDSYNLRLPATDFTINYWVILDKYSDSTATYVLSKNNGFSKTGWGASVTGWGALNNSIKKVGRTLYDLTATKSPLAVGERVIYLNAWYMVTIQYDFNNKTATFYLNGVLDKQTTNIPAPDAAAGALLYIGTNPAIANSTLSGKLDQVRIYNRKLSANERKTLYKAYK